LEADELRELKEEIMHGRGDPPHSMTAATRRIRHALALAVFAALSAGISVAQGAPQQGSTPASQIARHFQHEDALYQLSERAASSPTPQGVRADGLRWQGIARAYELSERSANTPTPQGLKADGLRWQAIAKAYRQSVAPKSSPQQIGIPLYTPKMLAAHFNREDLLYQPRPSVSAVSDTLVSNGFDWSDWAIGLGSGIGLILALGGGLAIGRQWRHRAQTA
jgi:hypothetical protein